MYDPPQQPYSWTLLKLQTVQAEGMIAKMNRLQPVPKQGGTTTRAMIEVCTVQSSPRSKFVTLKMPFYGLFLVFSCLNLVALGSSGRCTLLWWRWIPARKSNHPRTRRLKRKVVSIVVAWMSVAHSLGENFLPRHFVKTQGCLFRSQSQHRQRCHDARFALDNDWGDRCIQRHTLPTLDKVLLLSAKAVPISLWMLLNFFWTWSPQDSSAFRAFCDHVDLWHLALQVISSIDDER